MHCDRSDLIPNGTSGVQNWTKWSILLIFLFLLEFRSANSGTVPYRPNTLLSTDFECQYSHIRLSNAK